MRQRFLWMTAFGLGILTGWGLFHWNSNHKTGAAPASPGSSAPNVVTIDSARFTGSFSGALDELAHLTNSSQIYLGCGLIVSSAAPDQIPRLVLLIEQHAISDRTKKLLTDLCFEKLIQTDPELALTTAVT